MKTPPPHNVPFARVSLVALCVAVSIAAAKLTSADVIVYNNTTNFTGQAVTQGGATTANGNVTNMFADDLMLIAGAVGQSVTQFSFSVYNSDPTVDISARARVRFFATDGSGGGPGTLLAAISFNPFSFTHNQVTTLSTGPLGALSFTLPASSTTIWAGVFFDNAGGATATTAQLNELGQGFFNPPTVGSSQDRYFATSGGGVPGANPAGTITNFGGAPVANFGWQIQTAAVPEPSSLALAAFGGVGLLLSARRVLRRR